MSDNNQAVVVIINRAGMGNAPSDLQETLISTYFKVILGDNHLPKAICFYGEGVKLAVDGSPVLDSLKKLEAAGVDLILCSTCLNYFHLKGRVAVGIVGGMTDITAAMWQADKVITL